MRCTNELTFEIIGPTMQRTDDIVGVAAAVKHLGLTVATDVGDQINALRIAHEHTTFFFSRQGGVIADVGHHEFMADVTRARTEYLLDFLLQQRIVEIDVDRKLRVGSREIGNSSQIGHPHPQINLHQPKRERIHKNLFSTEVSIQTKIQTIKRLEEEILDRTGHYT